MADFTIRLEQSYWTKGFFNVGVDFERYFTSRDGAFEIYLEDASTPVVGRISRSVNQNATPRIYGNKALATFFQERFRVSDLVRVEVLADTAIRLKAVLGRR